MGQLVVLGSGRQRSVKKGASAESEQGVKWLIGTKAFYWLIKPLKVFILYGSCRLLAQCSKEKKNEKGKNNNKRLELKNQCNSSLVCPFISVVVKKRRRKKKRVL